MIAGDIALEKPEIETQETPIKPAAIDDVKAIVCHWPGCAWSAIQDGVVTKCNLWDLYHIGCPISGGRAL